MVSDRELWACASQVLRQHGGGADAFVAKRVAELAKSGDENGVATWRAIATRMDALRDLEGGSAVRH